MKATIGGVEVDGAPTELAEFLNAMKVVDLPPRIQPPRIQPPRVRQDAAPVANFGLRGSPVIHNYDADYVSLTKTQQEVYDILLQYKRPRHVQAIAKDLHEADSNRVRHITSRLANLGVIERTTRGSYTIPAELRGECVKIPKRKRKNGGFGWTTKRIEVWNWLCENDCENGCKATEVADGLGNPNVEAVAALLYDLRRHGWAVQPRPAHFRAETNGVSE